jgi:hypothetical protein
MTEKNKLVSRCSFSSLTSSKVFFNEEEYMMAAELFERLDMIKEKELNKTMLPRILSKTDSGLSLELDDHPGKKAKLYHFVHAAIKCKVIICNNSFTLFGQTIGEYKFYEISSTIHPTCLYC